MYRRSTYIMLLTCSNWITPLLFYRTWPLRRPCSERSPSRTFRTFPEPPGPCPEKRSPTWDQRDEKKSGGRSTSRNDSEPIPSSTWSVRKSRYVRKLRKLPKIEPRAGVAPQSPSRGWPRLVTSWFEFWLIQLPRTVFPSVRLYLGLTEFVVYSFFNSRCFRYYTDWQKIPATLKCFIEISLSALFIHKWRT